MKITDVQIKNFRSVESMEITFPPDLPVIILPSESYRKIKSYKTGQTKSCHDFRRYGTPMNYFKHLKGFLLTNQVAQLLSTLASFSSPQLGWRATISWKLSSPNWGFCLC